MRAFIAVFIGSMIFLFVMQIQVSELKSQVASIQLELEEVKAEKEVAVVSL